MKLPLRTPYVAVAYRPPGSVPALWGAQCPRWGESLGHSRRGTPTSQLGIQGFPADLLTSHVGPVRCFP